MDPEADDAELASVAALGEPIRRALYRFVSAQAGPVTREQAASGTRVAVHVAKFHLDKLAAEGLLEAGFARPEGRTGPGAGRPAKLYRRAAQEIAVSLPPRRYELAGGILATAVDSAQLTGTALKGALADAATAAGREIAADALAGSASESGLPAVLAAHGFEPRIDGDRITLGNCPFHRLAQQHTDLICGMNLHLLRALLGELDADGVTAELDPAPGRCCVALRRGQPETG
jgi:predicted ArsR family transcriptional regulator